jgi:hypothetical protein
VVDEQLGRALDAASVRQQIAGPLQRSTRRG